MFEAKARAGGSVMLPASRPLRSMKLIFKTAREDADEHEREHGDARAGEQPLQAGGAEDGGEEFCTRAQADGGEEKRDAEFAEGEVRIHRHVPDLASDAAHAAEDERDDKGAAGKAELDRLRQSGEGDGQRSEGDAEGDADEGTG